VVVDAAEEEPVQGEAVRAIDDGIEAAARGDR
jgi:hypothetical protein